MNKVYCPICNAQISGHMADWPDYPFCSKRCRTIDLGRWLSEEYRIPSRDPEPENESSKSANVEE